MRVMVKKVEEMVEDGGVNWGCKYACLLFLTTVDELTTWW